MADRAHLTAETAAVISDVASKTTYIGGLGGFFAWLHKRARLFIDLFIYQYLIIIILL